MKRINALAHMLSQKHLAEAEENHRLKLTASAAIPRNPRAGRIKNTINKPFNTTSNPLKGKVVVVTGSNLNPSPALTATAQPPSKKAQVEPDISSVAHGGVLDGPKGSEGMKPDAKGNPHTSGISAHDLEIQTKVFKELDKIWRS